jgi:hypothetical protein
MKCQGKATFPESHQVGPEWQWALQALQAQQAPFLEWLSAPLPLQASSPASQLLPA